MEECLQNDLFYVGWDAKTLTQSLFFRSAYVNLLHRKDRTILNFDKARDDHLLVSKH